ncbi:hypothetical protein ACOSQ3_014461 [Xanthoceras sorbifolium]
MKKKGFSQSLGSLRFLSLLRAISDFSWASLVRENSRRRINHVFLRCCKEFEKRGKRYEGLLLNVAFDRD